MKLILDTKETRWWRQEFNLTAEEIKFYSRNGELDIAAVLEAIQIGELEETWSEEVDGSCDSMLPEDNQGWSTVELFKDKVDEDCKLFKNGL
jgi:hypothetical protein